MKKNLYFIYGLMILTLASSCQESEPQTETPPGTPTGVYLSHSACQTRKAGSLSEDNSKECLVFTYRPDVKVLELTHKNAGFNCCPDSIYCDFDFSGDTLIISETEESALCNCLCLFDLTLRLENVAPNNWFIQVQEPYLEPTEYLQGAIDLNEQPEGELCATRDNYPWGNY
ncbi:MAG TPA: hypothetical protein DCQ26_16845 [Marinilabiliales bacterium]|jgi:hypothetical protein|nr:MAG: hypothetical protein A2W97_09405 [Bacteroidetes bacterium GWE2_40_63]OFY23351.1 MAG: hypothetical protein A2W88_10645 [Bacteroidetes bacterium GWF2_40_13]OFZ29599.1 MAG: hypothetical protein A2437_08865 [Bacteroidetes bacterium RIFOXYC2_FULL_40_12]HAN00264.1 hypothetical protein [Marinilabiliales bacterium]HAZ01932.1 hypothetical protein [Marinilabiliales bacterium]